MKKPFEILLPVIVGAVLGVVPVITNTTLQSRAAARQMMFERKLTAIRDFSNACNRRLLAVTRLTAVLDTIYVFAKQPSEPRLSASSQMGVDFIFKQFETLGNDSEDAYVSLQAEADFVNAVFGTQIPIRLNPEVPPRLPFVLDGALERINKAVEAMRSDIPKFTEDCASTAKLLNSKLDY